MVEHDLILCYHEVYILHDFCVFLRRSSPVLIILRFFYVCVCVCVFLSFFDVITKIALKSLQMQLGGKRVGIVGLGSIGSEIAKRLEAFGCIIAYNSRKKKAHVSYPYYANVNDLAANSDVLIVCCALTKETHHLINKDVMTAVGKTGVVINVGRGALIDEKELAKFLMQGEIRGAGLDVFEDEPSVPEELFELDNVVLSPHRAVGTPESMLALKNVVVGNLSAFFANKPLLSQIMPE